MPASEQATAIHIGDPGSVPLASLRRVYLGKPPVHVDDSVWNRVVESNEAILRIVASGDPVYGVNTGFGLLAQCRIPDEQLGALQRNLVLSHNAGVGDYLDERVTRLILFLKIPSLFTTSFRASPPKARSAHRATWHRWRTLPQPCSAKAMSATLAIPCVPGTLCRPPASSRSNSARRKAWRC